MLMRCRVGSVLITVPTMTVPDLRHRLRHALTVAMKARDRAAIAALRSTLAAIDNAESVPIDQRSRVVVANEHVAGASSGVGTSEVARRELTEADLRSIVEREVRDRLAAADEYDRHGQHEPAETLRAEADAIRPHLHTTE